MTKKAIVLAAAVLMLAGCSAKAPESAPASGSGQPFLPAYLAMLQGKPFPQDDSCHPRNLHELLLPCDTPDPWHGPGGVWESDTNVAP